MPGVNYGQDGVNGLGRMIGKWAHGTHALGAQQQGVISDNLGRPVIRSGITLYGPTDTDPKYGFVVMDPITNKQLMFMGYDSGAGAAYIAFYDANGNVVNKFDLSGQHVYDSSDHEVVRLDQTGLHVYDDAGHENARLGLLPNSQYGVGVWNTEHDGSWGWLDYQNYAFGNWSQVGTSQSTTSTTWADLATAGPSVSLDVGSDGFGLVRASVMTEAPANQTVSVGVSIDGAAPTFAQMQFANGVASPINAPLFAEISYSGLTPGNHTFKLQYETSGGTATFWNRYLFVSNGG